MGATLGTERFLQEIRFASHLQHPHILPIFDAGNADGQLWYTMPFVEGESLRERLRREKQLPIADALRITREVADALDYSHRHRVIHRDIKPENILLEEGHALVADFGIARALDSAAGERLTEGGLVLGTPAHMSPEQGVADSPVDGRSDLYALGCVAYEMLTGTPPFTGSSPQAILARHGVDPVPPLRTLRPSVPPHVEDALVRALAKVPADRFPTAHEFAAQLTIEHTAEPRRRLTLKLSSAAVLLAGTTGVAAVALWRQQTPSSPAIVPPADRIAVLPLIPPSADTALIRLGRDLAVTISASLDGVGDITTADRLSIAAQTAARRLGASSVLRGTLVGSGDRVRLDLGLTRCRLSVNVLHDVVDNGISGDPDHRKDPADQQHRLPCIGVPHGHLADVGECHRGIPLGSVR